MRKFNGLLIIFVFASFLLINTQVAHAANGFVVEKGGSDKILITDGYSEYVIEHDYNCYSSDFYEGATIYIDTSYSPSYGDKIIISGYSDTICEITSSEDVNIKRYYVDDVFDSEDKIIVTDKNSDKFLVEYGIGCGVSMWRYEGKTIDIDIGGSFLDGIGDRIYLFDSGRDCKVWDADELSSGSNAPAYPLPFYNPTPSASCPANSYSNGDKCTCITGYVANSAKTGCELAPIPTPLECGAGFLAINDQCVSYTQDCGNTFGSNVVGSPGPNNNSSCNCASGYQWNNTQTTCVKIVALQSLPVSMQVQNEPPLVPIQKKEFLIDDAKIKNYNPELLGEINTSATLRKCPSVGDCDVLRYYVEGVRVKIIDDYNNGEWYKVVIVDSKQEGWMHSSLINKIAPQEIKPQSNKLKENNGNVSEKTQKDIPWYKKVFSFWK